MSDGRKNLAEVCANVTIHMVLREGETEEVALERFYNALYDGLCNNTEHHIDFEIEEQEVC